MELYLLQLCVEIFFKLWLYCIFFYYYAYDNHSCYKHINQGYFLVDIFYSKFYDGWNRGKNSAAIYQIIIELDKDSVNELDQYEGATIWGFWSEYDNKKRINWDEIG
jgi:hypothetical protein